MDTSELDYHLPEELIARYPAARREESRLLHLSRSSGRITHHIFCEFPNLLQPGDLLVMNDTRVFPARLLGRRWPDAGKVEALLLSNAGDDLWWAMVKPGKRIKSGDRLVFSRPGASNSHHLEAVVESYGSQSGGERLLRFEYEGDWWSLLEEIGHTPLPPYILQARKHDIEHELEPASNPKKKPLRPEETETPEDRNRYQTVFAGSERASVAAPTAGLHFSETVFRALDEMNVRRVFLQLHVGAGTFQPIKTDRVEEHTMHEEYIRISLETADALHQARTQGRRIVAIGTTAVRALETAALVTAQGKAGFFREDLDGESLKNEDKGIAATAREQNSKEGQNSGCEHELDKAELAANSGRHRQFAGEFIRPMSGYTKLLINPGFQFRATDALLTNFHLPRSTLLLLIDAFAGRHLIRGAYEEAVRERYRFYSYGDCMLIE